MTTLCWHRRLTAVALFILLAAVPGALAAQAQGLEPSEATGVARLASIVQDLGQGQVRTVTFTYDSGGRRHDSGEFSEYTNVASQTKSCGESTTAVASAVGGATGGGTPKRGSASGAWLGLLVIAGLMMSMWRRRARLTLRQAVVSVLVLVGLLSPARALA